MNCLFKSVEHEIRMRHPTGSPANDAASESVNDKGDIDEALPGRYVCEIG